MGWDQGVVGSKGWWSLGYGGGKGGWDQGVVVGGESRGGGVKECWVKDVEGLSGSVGQGLVGVKGWWGQEGGRVRVW